MRIDVSKINGYEDMSAEDKISALEAFEYEDYSEEAKKFKNAFDKASHELSDAKHQIKDAQDKAGKGNSDLEELRKEFAEYKASTEREKRISRLTSMYVAKGYDVDLASETATAYVDGNDDVVFANERKWLEAYGKQIKSDILKQTPKPGQGGTGKQAPAMTLEKFRKLSQAERMKFAAEFPEEYAKLYGG